jgi:uncharacterized protein YlzI (FlbEa/FlbD family)
MLIRLTEEGENVWVNHTAVVLVTPDGTSAMLLLSTGKELYVDESVTEVVNAIKAEAQ